ncbi:MAG: hypothetical protein IKH88_02245 [Prevotella sp.]|nr:hypothetical protein [Prevotella sp.]
MKEKLNEKRTIELAEPTALFLEALQLACEALEKAMEARDLLVDEFDLQTEKLNTDVLESHNAFQDAIWRFMSKGMYSVMIEQYLDGKAFNQL